MPAAVVLPAGGLWYVAAGGDADRGQLQVTSRS